MMGIDKERKTAAMLQLKRPNGLGVAAFSLRPGDSSREMQIDIDGAGYWVRIAELTRVVAPGETSRHGVAIVTGRYGSRAGDGSVLIVVNCGSEPPDLRLTMRPSAAPASTWCAEITHQTQDELVGFFEECWARASRSRTTQEERGAGPRPAASIPGLKPGVD